MRLNWLITIYWNAQGNVTFCTKNIKATLTRMHSSRMRTVHSSSRLSRGGSASVHAGIPPPRSRPSGGQGTPPQEQTPPGTRHPPRPGTPRWSRHSPRADTPPWDQEHAPSNQVPPCGQKTDTCKNRNLRNFVEDSKNQKHFAIFLSLIFAIL